MNRWLIRIDYGRNPVTQQRVRRNFTVVGTKAAAQRRMNELLRERDHGFAIAPEKLTVGDWLTGWLERHRADGKVGPRSYERYRGIIRGYLLPAVGHVKLQELRPDHIAELKARWLAAGLSAATVHKHFVVMRRAFKDALAAGLLSRNPAAAIPAPSPNRREERRALTEDEITALLVAARGTRYDAPIRFTLATGLRQAELLALRWEDVDLDHATVTVRGTKTHNSRRTIELSAATVALLRTHKQEQLARRLRLGPLWHEQGLVFPSSVGTPWLRRPFYRDYRRVLGRSGIAEVTTVNWHTLRHTAATQWLRHNADVFTVSRRLGHASAAFTMDVYAHLLKGQQRQAAEALDHLLAW